MAVHDSADAKMRIALLRLTDAAPVVIAHELGFFADEGVETELFTEPSWANIADKLAYGFLDAAVMVPPLAFAVSLGLRGHAQPLVIPYVISLGGNTITLESGFADRLRALALRDGMSLPQALATQLRSNTEPPVFAVVHVYSTHNLLLRYWLSTAGISAGQDVTLAVVPPAGAVDALRTGRISGFCAGAPWGEIAAREKIGTTVATSFDIWRNGPEKAFAVREQWAAENPKTLEKVLRALLRAAKFCDAPENASYTAALLSRQKYLGVDSHAILSSLPGGSIAPSNVSVFYRNAATFPWRSHALWFLREMVRWKLVDPSQDLEAISKRIYRPDLYRAALAPLGIAMPNRDIKSEGHHAERWMLDAKPEAIVMGPDTFCDGAVYDAE